MKSNFLIPAIGVVFFLLLTAGADAWFGVKTPYPEVVSIGLNITSFEDIQGRLERLARDKGGAYAYEVLRQANLPPNLDLHLLGHSIGDILYVQKGVEGIADCTQDFRNACSHSIVVGALGEFGPGADTLAHIDDACKKAPGGSGAYTMCYHGLGHGVLAFFGYDLAQTSALCKQMGTREYHDEQYTQCVGGAIMELMGGGGHDKEKWLAARERYLTDDEPLAPCDTALVPDATKSFCYMYLTPRLLELAGADLGSPDPAMFPKAFSFCDAIPRSEERLRDSCFGGFGKEFVPLAAGRDIRAIDKLSDSQYALAIEWCGLSPMQDGMHSCVLEGLESVFWGGENDTQASFRYCTLVPDSLQDDCHDKLGEMIGRYLEGDRETSWCVLLPTSSRSLCNAA